MARQVTCVCGRRFFIGHRSEGVQCRKCGRWWSGREIGVVGGITMLLLGGEIAMAERKGGKQSYSGDRSHRGKQTSRRRPSLNPVGSVLRWLFT